MFQIYLLSILTIVLASVSLGFDALDDRLHVSAFLAREAVTNPSFALGLGVVTLLVGFFQFLSTHPDDVVFLGNLVPAATGMVLGFTLMLVFYRSRSTVESALVERLDAILLHNATNLAYLGLIVALLHFFFPRVLFL